MSTTMAPLVSTELPGKKNPQIERVLNPFYALYVL